MRSLIAQSEKLLLAPPATTALEKARSATALSGSQIIDSLSYTHIEQLAAIDDANKRACYEKECIRGCWSVREQKRQISSLLYERSEFSVNK